jgi:hypothetical protein
VAAPHLQHYLVSFSTLLPSTGTISRSIPFPVRQAGILRTSGKHVP